MTKKVKKSIFPSMYEICKSNFHLIYFYDNKKYDGQFGHDSCVKPNFFTSIFEVKWSKSPIFDHMVRPNVKCESFYANEKYARYVYVFLLLKMKMRRVIQTRKKSVMVKFK